MAKSLVQARRQYELSPEQLLSETKQSLAMIYATVMVLEETMRKHAPVSQADPADQQPAESS